MSDKIKVLLIEDSLGDVHLFSDMILEGGDGCIELNHNLKLSSGLDRLRKGNYDVLLLDLELPDSKGLDTLRAVRKQFKDIPIVVVTENNNESEEIEAAKLGAQDYLIKGHFDDQLLIKTIRYTVERKKQEIKLTETNQLLETIFNSTNTLLAYFDKEFNFVRVNKSYAKAANKEPDYFVGKNHFELYPHPENEEIFKNVVKTGEPFYTYAKAFEHPDSPERGTTYWDWSLIPIKTDDGIVAGLIFTLSDITERIKSQKKIKEEKSRAQSYLDIAGVMFVVINKDQQVTLINKKGCQILGYEEKEILGKNWFDLIVTKENREHVKEVYNHLMKGEIEAAEYYENPIITKDGQVRVIAWRNSVIKDEYGHIIGTISSGEDITEEKKAKEALYESEQRFRTMADTAPILIWMSGTDKKCTFFNKGWLEFRGRKMEEEIRDGRSEGVHPDDLEFCLKTYNSAFDNREEFTMEYRLQRFDGDYRWILDRGVPRYNVDGSFAGYIGSCMDITDRKLAEDELSVNKARFEGILSSAMDAIISVDSEQKIILFNSAAEKMFRINSSEAIGKNLGVFIPDQYKDVHREHIKGFGKTNVSTRSMGKLGMVMGSRANGEVFPIEASISQVDIHGHKIYTVIMREIKT